MPSKEIKKHFKPSELLLGFQEFKKLCAESELDTGVRLWLNNWEQLDLMQSPMDDSHRKWYRLGHYVGWFSFKSTAEIADEDYLMLGNALKSDIVTYLAGKEIDKTVESMREGDEMKSEGQDKIEFGDKDGS